MPRRRAAQGQAETDLAGRRFSRAATAARPPCPASPTRACWSRPCVIRTISACRPRGNSPTGRSRFWRRWVKLGVPWPGAKAPPAPTDGRFTITEKHRQFWSFQPVKAVPPPAVRDAAWPRSAIDRFILAGLEAKGIAPAAPADKRTLLRRATFDLIGLPPTPAEIDAFLADDSPQAFARVVDRLLASPLLRRALGAALARRRPLRRRPRPDPVAAARATSARPGATGTGSSNRSTATCRTRSSFAPRLPATCCLHRVPAASTRTAWSPRDCWPSRISCPATSIRTR